MRRLLGIAVRPTEEDDATNGKMEILDGPTIDDATNILLEIVRTTSEILIHEGGIRGGMRIDEGIQGGMIEVIVIGVREGIESGMSRGTGKGGMGRGGTYLRLPIWRNGRRELDFRIPLSFPLSLSLTCPV